MTEREQFVAAMYATPDDDAVKLVFADWLDEHNEPHAAAQLRWWCATRRPLLASMLDEPLTEPDFFVPPDDTRWRLAGVLACRTVDVDINPRTWGDFWWPEGWSRWRMASELEHARTTIVATQLAVLPWMELTAIREPLHDLLEHSEAIRAEAHDGKPELWAQAFEVSQTIQRLLALTQDLPTWYYWLTEELSGASTQLLRRYLRGLRWLRRDSTYGRATS